MHQRVTRPTYRCQFLKRHKLENKKATGEYFGKEGTKPKRVAAVRGERPDDDFEHRRAELKEKYREILYPSGVELKFNFQEYLTR